MNAYKSTQQRPLKNRHITKEDTQTANKYMKSCAARKYTLKNYDYHYIFNRCTKIKKKDHRKC